MHSFEKIWRDFIGLCRTCGCRVASRWLFAVVANLGDVFRRRDLQPADRHLGAGPFEVRRAGVCFKVAGHGVVSGIREMYIRDSYLLGGTLRISDGDTVLDLGANMGNFTALALAYGPSVRVVAVEPGSRMNYAFVKSVGLNPGYIDRTTLIRAFVGQMGKVQEDSVNTDAQYADAPWITEDELILRGNLSRIDFLKCDIEGGEFELLGKGSKLLARTTALAIEVHAFAGDVAGFLADIEASGFALLSVKWDPDGSCTALARRT